MRVPFTERRYMSGVPQRNRNLSSYEFYTQAVELRLSVLSLVSGSTIPKSRRFTFAVPMAESARSVVYNIVKADAFYPNSEDAVTMRKRYLTLAIADVEQIERDMQAYAELYRRLNGEQHAHRFAMTCELCEREIELLKGARKNVRLIGKRKE